MPDLLKPCPFCGASAMVEYSGINGGIYYVQCTNCGVHLWDYGKSDAISHWNRRAEDPDEDDAM